jgi:hypothetical protein
VRKLETNICLKKKELPTMMYNEGIIMSRAKINSAHT